MNKSALSILLLWIGFTTYAQTANPSTGTIVRLEDFSSKYIQNRNIDVWLPEDYKSQNSQKKYNVIYMHDGQMLFDSTITWNHQEWKVDETVSALIKQQKIKDCILVGIWNTGENRISEYLPNKIYNKLTDSVKTSFSDKYCNHKGAQGDAYLQFVITELKPYIDSHFSTCSARENTFMMGSSMGGLISLYAVLEYPDVFSGVACLSTAWLSMIKPHYEFPLAEFNYLKETITTPSGTKIYMDYGTGESDELYELTQNFINQLFVAKGFSKNQFVCPVFEKAEHNEKAWSNRLETPLLFLVKK